MSDTPRTDNAVRFAISRGMTLAPLAEFARELERENAALRSLIDDPNAMHSHYLRQCNGWEVWQAERIHWFQDTVDKLERENAALRSLLREAVTDYELLGGTCDGVESEDHIARVKAALGEAKP